MFLITAALFYGLYSLSSLVRRNHARSPQSKICMSEGLPDDSFNRREHNPEIAGKSTCIKCSHFSESIQLNKFAHSLNVEITLSIQVLCNAKTVFSITLWNAWDLIFCFQYTKNIFPYKTCLYPSDISMFCKTKIVYWKVHLKSLKKDQNFKVHNSFYLFYWLQTLSTTFFALNQKHL